MATTNPITTAEQLLEAPGLGRCELVQGELNMMSPAGADHGRIGTRVVAALLNHADAFGLGAVYGADTGFCIHRDPDTVRSPDAAFIRAERIPPDPMPGYFPGAPDLAVEVLSPTDRATEVAAKVLDWLDAGCREVWVVDLANQTVTVHRGRANSQTIRATESLDGGDLLPGFCLALADIFRR